MDLNPWTIIVGTALIVAFIVMVIDIEKERRCYQKEQRNSHE